VLNSLEARNQGKALPSVKVAMEFKVVARETT